jgi:hypothetical protein
MMSYTNWRLTGCSREFEAWSALQDARVQVACEYDGHVYVNPNLMTEEIGHAVLHLSGELAETTAKLEQSKAAESLFRERYAAVSLSLALILVIEAVYFMAKR